jgi:hypothetical protein
MLMARLFLSPLFGFLLQDMCFLTHAFWFHVHYFDVLRIEWL